MKLKSAGTEIGLLGHEEKPTMIIDAPDSTATEPDPQDFFDRVFKTRYGHVGRVLERAPEEKEHGWRAQEIRTRDRKPAG